MRTVYSFRHSQPLRGEQLLDYIGSRLRVTYVRDGSVHKIRLSNVGPRDIPPDEYWAIYFNHAPAVGFGDVLRLQGFRMFHVDGWLYGIETVHGGGPLSVSFPGIPAGSSITLLCSASLMSRSYAFPR